VDLLLKAISKAPKSPDCVIVGDGPARKKLEALSRSLRLDRRVRFAGEVKHSDLARYYRGARFFALPSLAEAFPLTALEAMACGTPIVASEVGAAGSLIHSTSCGLSFRPGDVDDLAAKITAVSSSLESARQMGANGRRSALERYSWTRVGSQMTALYAAAQTVGRSAAATASGPVEHEA
jgi:glycosyltransferase involved in cell wall biosynthesis